MPLLACKALALLFGNPSPIIVEAGVYLIANLFNEYNWNNSIHIPYFGYHLILSSVLDLALEAITWFPKCFKIEKDIK